jgi:D-3-phosphoglycerate dehydrogenase / 2-oxoglutarate reductase
MNRPVVLMTRADFYPEGWAKRTWPTLSKSAEIRMTALKRGTELLAQVADADVLYTRNPFAVSREVLTAGENLRGVVTAAVGYESIDVDAATDLGIAVANSPGNTASMAEATILLLLAVAKRLPFWMETARTGTAAPHDETSMEAFGKTIGIVGFGRIGKATAALARALGMKVLAYGRRAEKSDLADLVPLDELLQRSDFVSLHANLTPQTHHLIDAGKLALMKPTAFIVNTARGELIDEPALVEALRAGRIAGAALDVFEEEPPKADNPLFSMPNVICTPHRLGHSLETRRRIAELAEQSILALLRGELPEFTVNRDLNWRFAS